MIIDYQNTAWCADQIVQPNTRYFLTSKKLITRSDKLCDVTAKGNGYIISDKGLEVLGQQEVRTTSAVKDTKDGESDVQKTAPTDKQLKYASDLGIQVPPDATGEELSDLISSRLENDEASNEKLLSIAAAYKVRHTRFTGKSELFDRIFDTLNRPTREVDLLAWFVFQVYRGLEAKLGKSLRSFKQDGIYSIAKELASDELVLDSVRRYRGHHLMHFGDWTDSSGFVHTGASVRTIAYERAAELLQSKFV